MVDSLQDDRDSQFVALLTDCQLPLLLYVRSLLPGESAARDVAQEASAKIWEKRADFQIGTNFKAWAFSIARYEVLNYRKLQSRDAKLMFSEDLAQTIADELAQARGDIEDRHEALKECLQTLRPQDRRLLLHRYSNTSPLAEYAAEYQRSVGGLKLTLHRLRTSLLRCIEGRLASEEGIS